MKHLYEFDHYLTEGKNVADSYHFTNTTSLLGILKTGIRFSKRKFEREQQESWWKNRLSKRNDDYTKYISLTRHKDIGKILNEMTQMPVRITLDTAAISNRYKIIPIDFVGQVTDTAEKSHKHKGDMAMVSSIAANAFEERIISPKKDDADEFLPLQYIKKIDVFMKSGTSHDKAAMGDLRTTLGSSGIAYEMHLTYPEHGARLKSDYNLQGIQLEDGLKLDKISPMARKTLSALVVNVQKQFKSDALKITVSEFNRDSYHVRVLGDLPYHQENRSEATLYTAKLNRAGVLSGENYKSSNVEEFEKQLTKPYIFDDYMNDQIKVYLVKKLLLSFAYEQNNGEVVIKDVNVIDLKEIDAEVMFDIISRIIPRRSECSLLLPPELRRFRVETAFEDGLGYSMDKHNPAQINYTPPVYKDDYELYKDLE